MKSGTLRNRVQFYGPAALDDFGSGRKLGALMFTEYCDVIPITGRREREWSDYQEVDHKIVMRFRPDSFNGVFAKLGTQYFRIKTSINEDMRNRKLTLLAQEIKGEEIPT